MSSSTKPGADDMKLIIPMLVLCAFTACCEGRKPENAVVPAAVPTTAPATREWAVAIEKSGLPNLHRVSADLYRGAQTTEEGMRELKAMGIKTVVNLRSFHSDRDEIGDTDLAYEHLYVKAWHPEKKEVARFLQIVTDKNRAPVFVHCQHGADRTGLMCAAYRVAVCGWTKEEAIQEMREGNFGFHEVWKNIVKYMNDLDVESIKQQIGKLAQ